MWVTGASHPADEAPAHTAHHEPPEGTTMTTRRLAATAAGLLLALATASTAHATPPAPVQVKIYLANVNHNADTVTTSCGETGPQLHTAVFNDAVGANTTETVKIYREDGGPTAAATWPAIWGPVNVPAGGHAPVDLPYIAGTSYNAVAIPAGDPWPATLADIIGRLSAHPPTADNSQLFPSGYPAAPSCPTPTPTTTVPTTTPNPCPTHQIDPAAVVPTCMTATPTEPTTKPITTTSSPAVTPTTGAPTTTSATLGLLPSSTLPSATGTPTTPAATASTAANTTALAHTGASVLPLTAAALALLAAGGAAIAYTRRARPRRH